MTPLIRPITEADVVGFHSALGVVAREKLYLALEDAPPIELTHTVVARLIATGSPAFVADANGEIVGWCDITIAERETMAHCGTLGMGIIPVFRGQGVGQKLMEAALAAADAKGLKRVQLHVFTTNTRAKALYEKMGFVEEGLRRAAFFIDGRFFDDFAMARVRL
jgi:ribosomal protein S18 acetylase RimI-like enzyme